MKKPHTSSCVRRWGGRAWCVSLTSALLALSNAATAQTPSATISGVLLDRSTGAPLPDVSIYVGEGERIVRSGPDGVFVLSGIQPGQQVLVMRRIGYRPRGFRFVLTENHMGPIALGNLEMDPQVMELEEIVVEGREGGARLEGFYRRRAQGFGNFISREDIEVGMPRQSTDLFRRIPGVVVNCRGNDCQLGFARQDRPPGQSVLGAAVPFVDGDGNLAGGQSQIGRNQSVVAPDARAFVSGISGDSQLVCPIQMFVDGVPYETSRGINEVSPDMIEGIEIYKGPATTPARFARPGASCGVIAIWTRRPGA